MELIMPDLINLPKKPGVRIRIIRRGDEPWFLGRDVFEVLGLDEDESAYNLLRETWRVSETMATIYGPKEVTFLSVNGFFELIGRVRREKFNFGWIYIRAALRRQPIKGSESEDVGRGDGFMNVNARKIHAIFGIRNQFINWIKNRIKQHEFIKNIDFMIIRAPKGRKTKGKYEVEYFLSAYMAKEIALVERRAMLEVEPYKTAMGYIAVCEAEGEVAAGLVTEGELSVGSVAEDKVEE
jgi:phage anti-repressor protein